jgi:hypothetical protein
LGFSSVTLPLHDECRVTLSVTDEDTTVAYPCLAQRSFDRFRRELVSIAEDLDIIQATMDLKGCRGRVDCRFRRRIPGRDGLE